MFRTTVTQSYPIVFYDPSELHDTGLAGSTLDVSLESMKAAKLAFEATVTARSTMRSRPCSAHTRLNRLWNANETSALLSFVPARS